MKIFTIAILINILLMNFCYGQNDKNEDFFEFGIRTSTYLESSFLEDSRYQNQLSNPLLEDIGLIASPTGRNYSARLRYGKKIFTNTHLMSEIGYTQLNEQVVCYCNQCDKIPIPTTLATLNAISTGVGFRYNIIRLKKINFSIEAVGNYSILLNESNINYFGYSFHPLIQYEISKKIKVNLKYGYEQSFNDYKKKERYIELAFNFNK